MSTSTPFFDVTTVSSTNSIASRCTLGKFEESSTAKDGAAAKPPSLRLRSFLAITSSVSQTSCLSLCLSSAA